MPEAVVRAERDLARGRTGLVLWGAPLLAIVVTAFADVTSPTRGVVWAVALFWSGAACAINAWRSGRLHCSLTGPFFIALAAAAFLHGLGVLPLGPHGWLWIGTLLALGAPSLTILPEKIWGRYSKRGEERCC